MARGIVGNVGDENSRRGTLGQLVGRTVTGQVVDSKGTENVQYVGFPKAYLERQRRGKCPSRTRYGAPGLEFVPSIRRGRTGLTSAAPLALRSKIGPRARKLKRGRAPLVNTGNGIVFESFAFAVESNIRRKIPHPVL